MYRSLYLLYGLKFLNGSCYIFFTTWSFKGFSPVLGFWDRRKPGLKLGDQFQREGQKPRYEVEKGEEHEAGRKDEVTDGKAEDNRWAAKWACAEWSGEILETQARCCGGLLSHLCQWMGFI